MRTVDDIQFINKKVLVRVDFNVPFEKGTFQIADDTRIKAAIPTIMKIADDGGAVILMSHLGRPKGEVSEAFSLRHLVDRLAELTQKKVVFSNDCIGQEAEKMIGTLGAGDILLLENLRFHKEEEKGDKEFARTIAGYGDIYVNDAFGTAHRAHASTSIMAEFFSAENKVAGYLLADEVRNLEKVLRTPEKPLTAIVGGAKVSDKILVLEKLMDIADHILIGGGMAYTFLRAQGLKTGSSLCEEDKLDTASKIIEKAKSRGVQLHLPVDSVIADKFSKDAQSRTVDGDIPDGWMGLDIGPRTIKNYVDVIQASNTLLWNGPMGVFEFPSFENGTKEIALAVGEATAKGAYSLVGGGDSVAAVNKFGLHNKVSYVSTGGGAMLEYLEGKDLPGVVALRN